LLLFNTATLVVKKPSVFVNNAATRTGGGLRFYSGNFDPTKLEGMLTVENNTAGVAADISYAAWKIEVVDNGNAEELITSDGKEGGLTMVMNVSGPHGLPSNDQINYNVRDANNNILVQNTRLWPMQGVGGAVKTFPIGFKQEPGRYNLACIP
jgi:hypothetical protein